MAQGVETNLTAFVDHETHSMAMPLFPHAFIADRQASKHTKAMRQSIANFALIPPNDTSKHKEAAETVWGRRDCLTLVPGLVRVTGN